MANLKPVNPEIIGRPQTARRGVRLVQLANEGIGEGLGQLARGASKLAGALGGVIREREEADYRKTLNDAVAEVDTRMQDEVFSSEGFSAGGVSEKATGIYAEVGEKYAARLSGRNAERFSEYWGARRNGQMNRVMDFERSQLQGAQLRANKTLLESEVSNYTATLEPAALGNAKLAYDDSVRITNGGSLVSAETLAAFRKDLNDGDGKIKLPDGRTLRVAKEVKPGENDVISEKQLAEINSRLEKQAAAYEAGLQKVYDGAHTRVVERYLEDDRLAEAASYLDSVSADGYPQGISKGVLAECRDAVRRKQEVADISVEVTKMLAQLQTEAGTDDARYGGADQDRIYTQIRRQIADKYKGEKWQTGQRVLSMFAMRYRLLQDQQEATLASDTVAALTQIQKAGMTLPQQSEYIAGLKDSPLKAALQKAYERRSEAYNKNTDPVFLADQERRLNDFKLALGQGRATLDGVTYDFSNPEQLKAYVLNLGFTAQNQKRAAEYINNSNGRIDATLAAVELAKLLDMDDHWEALGKYPNLLKELDMLKGSSVIEPSKMGLWLRTNIAYLLQGEVSNYNSWWFNTSGTRGEYDESTADDLFKTKDQLINDWRTFYILQATNRGDVAEIKRLKTVTPTDKELADFARQREYRYENGRYYLRKGGK